MGDLVRVIRQTEAAARAWRAIARKAKAFWDELCRLGRRPRGGSA